MQKLKYLITFFLVLFVPSGLFAGDILPKTSLNAGEITPMLYGRTDLAKYSSALQTCKNAIPKPHGAVVRRPGLEYIATANSTDNVRLIPFEFSTTQAYVIETGPYYMRFYMDGGQIQGVDSSTKLLLNFESEDGSVTFTDEGVNTHTMGYLGDAQCDTSQYKYGSASVKLDGTGDFVFAGDHADWYMSTDEFTIDFWVRFNSVSGNQGFFGQYEDDDNRWYMYYNGTTDTVLFFVRDTASNTIAITDASWNPSVNTWYHVAIIRGWGGNANDWAITVDGTAIKEFTDSDGIPDLGGGLGSFYVGGCMLAAATTYYFNGWIDSFRVSKGIARWTSDFSHQLPTMAYPSGEPGGGGSVYSITTPYHSDDIPYLQWVQSADTLYLVHPNYSPRKLTRTTHSSWTLSIIGFTGTPSHWGNKSLAITGITAADPGVATSNGHGLSNSDQVLITNVAGMTEVNGRVFTVANKTDNTFELSGADTTNYTAYTSGGYWNEINKNPGTVVFHEERLVFAGSPAEPQTIDASKAGSYEDMTTGSGDTDGYQFTIASNQVNAIRWLESARRLLIGTTGGEWWMSGGGEDDVITPSNVKVRQDSGFGSQNIRPVAVSGDHVYVQRPGRNLRLLEYKFDDDAYIGKDLTILAEHLTDDYTITAIDVQKVPDQILWCVRSDGALLGMTYLPEHEVVAWHRHDTGASGSFKSIACIPGTNETEAWFVVERTIEGETVKYIERLSEFIKSSTSSDFVHVDSYLTYEGSAATAISGLDHLEGETVTIWADGAAENSEIVSVGAITIDNAAEVVHIGLGYDTDIETLKLDPGDGSLQGYTKRIHELIMRVYQTYGFQYGRDLNNLDTYTHSALCDVDDIRLAIDGIYDMNGQVFIRQSNAAPLTVLSIMPVFEAYGR